jgi:hypothetical protein
MRAGFRAEGRVCLSPKLKRKKKNERIKTHSILGILDVERGPEMRPEQFTPEEIKSISGLCRDILIKTQSIELAKLRGDYSTEKLLKPNLTASYGKGGRITTLKRIATDTVKRVFTDKRNGGDGENILTAGFESMLKICGVDWKGGHK